MRFVVRCAPTEPTKSLFEQALGLLSPFACVEMFAAMERLRQSGRDLADVVAVVDETCDVGILDAGFRKFLRAVHVYLTVARRIATGRHWIIAVADTPPPPREAVHQVVTGRRKSGTTSAREGGAALGTGGPGKPGGTDRGAVAGLSGRVRCAPRRSPDAAGEHAGGHQRRDRNPAAREDAEAAGGAPRRLVLREIGLPARRYISGRAFLRPAAVAGSSA